MNIDASKKGLVYLDIITADPRLNVWHISLLLAITLLAYRQSERNIIRVSRNKLMSISHIETAPTYHKYFQQLQEFGYFKYRPSYHPGYKSTIELSEIFFICTKDKSL